MERPLLSNLRVKFYTRSFSLELYRQSARLYEADGIPCVRLTDQPADGYFFRMLADGDCDIAINVDEDAFVANLDAVLDLAEYVVAHGYANAGCADVSPACPRSGNPIVTNPFFNVFDLRLIRTLWRGEETVREIARFNYATHKEELLSRWKQADYLDHTPSSVTPEALDAIYVEPYYNFFFWLALHFDTLYLRGVRHADGFSTVLYGPGGKVLCMHSWMSRFYRQRPSETRRIDALIDEVCAARGLRRLSFTAAERRGFLRDKILRFLIRIPQRIARWPHKWMIWYKRAGLRSKV